jgi:DNA-binding transcriptional LysR family regulator
MEWQQILGFYHAAKLGSFTKAADATFRSQSAISQQIKNLEEELGCLLFERMVKGRLRLTFAGKKVFKFSEKILKNYDFLTEELNEMKGLHMGQLRMAAPFTTLYHLFPFSIKTYTERFPHVELTILDRSQQDILDLIKNGDIDLGFVLESNVPKELSAFRWKKVRTVLMTPIDHPLAQGDGITLEGIGKYPLILPPKNLKYRTTLESRFRELHIDYHIIMESSNVELSSLYVEMGLGISFATVVMDLGELRQRKLAFLPMDHLFKPDHIAMVKRKSNTLVSYKQAFIGILFGDGAAEMASK